MMDVIPIPQLSDNYAYLIVDPSTREAGVVDCAEATPVSQRSPTATFSFARSSRPTITSITSAATATCSRGVPTCGSRVCRRRTQDSRHYESGPRRRLRRDRCAAWPRDHRSLLHTSGHVAYWFPEERSVFTGDTLFAGGCGRLFEGDAAQMMGSLGKLAALADDTRVYCGHGCTEKNLQFALTLEPGNAELRSRSDAVQALRRAGKPSIPSTIADEKRPTPSCARPVPSWRSRYGRGFPICGRVIRWQYSRPCALSKTASDRYAKRYASKSLPARQPCAPAASRRSCGRHRRWLSRRPAAGRARRPGPPTTRAVREPACGAESTGWPQPARGLRCPARGPLSLPPLSHPPTIAPKLRAR